MGWQGKAKQVWLGGCIKTLAAGEVPGMPNTSLLIFWIRL